MKTMMTIKNLKNFKFRDSIGVYTMTGFSLYVENKGFVTLDGKVSYSPTGGRKALQSIIDAGGFTEEPAYIMPL